MLIYEGGNHGNCCYLIYGGGSCCYLIYEGGNCCYLIYEGGSCCYLIILFRLHHVHADVLALFEYTCSYIDTQL